MIVQIDNTVDYESFMESFQRTDTEASKKWLENMLKDIKSTSPRSTVKNSPPTYDVIEDQVAEMIRAKQKKIVKVCVPQPKRITTILLHELKRFRCLLLHTYTIRDARYTKHDTCNTIRDARNTTTIGKFSKTFLLKTQTLLQKSKRFARLHDTCMIHAT